MIPKKLIYPIKLSHIQKYELSEGPGLGEGDTHLDFGIQTWREGQIISTTLLLSPSLPDFQTFLRPYHVFEFLPTLSQSIHVCHNIYVTAQNVCTGVKIFIPVVLPMLKKVAKMKFQIPMLGAEK